MARGAFGSKARPGSAASPQTGALLGAPLSRRQREILRLIAGGKSNKEIAERLGLATGTVKQHVYVLFRKLGVRSRTMAVVRGAQVLGGMKATNEQSATEAPAADAAADSATPDEARYARRLVTAVVIEPRPGPIRTSREAAAIENRIGVLRGRFERLGFAFDARLELLPGGGVAAWFGQPVAHGDDAARAVAFARALSADSGAEDGLACAVGIGTLAEVLGEGEKGSIAYRTFRVATLLASLAEPGEPLACALTSELAGLPPGAAHERAQLPGQPELPMGARIIGAPPPPSLAVAEQWGGLPFVGELVAKAPRGSSQWLGVESWPPEAGTRLIDAIGECLAAHGVPVRRLWMPAGDSGGDVARRLVGQLRAGWAEERARQAPELLAHALTELTASGPVALLVHGIDALHILKGSLGRRDLDRLRALPLIIVAGAMHRSGAPQTVVRLLGSHPDASHFVRVLRMRVPIERPKPLRGIRPDVQAVLDAVSAEARAIARFASNPGSCDIAAIAQALGMATDTVIERCRELENSGLLSVHEGRLQFRDETTAMAVRASQA